LREAAAIRVLAVSPRFAPTDGADTHRLRLLLPHAQGAGWSAEVLAVDPRDVPAPIDPALLRRLPQDLAVHRVRAWGLRGWGLNGLSQRAWRPLWRRGNELLASRRFDLVFFSTTEFALHSLGAAWKRRFGIPFCMDFQDPWVNDYYRDHPDIVPPGGRLKYALADGLHRFLERRTVPACGGFMAVSERYIAALHERYGRDVAGKPCLVRPFPAEPAEARTRSEATDAAPRRGEERTWRYIGRGGPDLKVAASAFIEAWAAAVRLGAAGVDDVRFEALGTSYAQAGTGAKSLEPLAHATAVGSRITESTDRLPYGAAMQKLADSDALVVFGSNDPAYTASKIYPYLLAGKPLLVIVHRDSPAVRVIDEVGGAVCVAFAGDEPASDIAGRIRQAWFASGASTRVQPLNRQALAAYTAERQAVEVREWMQAVLDAGGRHR